MFKEALVLFAMFGALFHELDATGVPDVDWIERDLVSEEGRGIDGVNSGKNLEECKRWCDQTDGCNSFAWQAPGTCWLKGRCLTEAMPGKIVGEFKSYYKPCSLSALSTFTCDDGIFNGYETGIDCGGDCTDVCECASNECWCTSAGGNTCGANLDGSCVPDECRESHFSVDRCNSNGYMCRKDRLAEDKYAKMQCDDKEETCDCWPATAELRTSGLASCRMLCIEFSNLIVFKPTTRACKCVATSAKCTPKAGHYLYQLLGSNT